MGAMHHSLCLLMQVSDIVRASNHSDLAIVLLLDFAFLDQLCQDFSSSLIVRRILLCFSELLLQLLDLIFTIVLDDVSQLLNFHALL